MHVEREKEEEEGILLLPQGEAKTTAMKSDLEIRGNKREEGT